MYGVRCLPGCGSGRVRAHGDGLEVYGLWDRQRKDNNEQVMYKDELLERFKKWALEIIFLCRDLPKAEEFNIIKIQLIKSSTSAAANYSASNRAKSKPDLINKRKIVEEELDESIFWLDMLNRLLNNWEERIDPLSTESNRLLGIIVNSIKSQR